MTNRHIYKPKIGLALGSGSARGWAHIGVINELAKNGIAPEIVAGSSIGALVGAAYASNLLDKLDKWVHALTWKEILNYIDVTLTGGGIIQGEKLLDLVRGYITEDAIESLPRKFGMVATELETGREVWFQQGELLEPLRASISVPGMFTPVNINGRWLVDGGLANPVPISLCRAMGADIVIAVNLNGDLVGKHTSNQALPCQAEEKLKNDNPTGFFERVSEQLKHNISEHKETFLARMFGDNVYTPGLFDVMASSINIMQDRITRSRMAGDPPDVILTPQLSQLGLLEFDKAAIAVNEGRESVRRMQPALEQLVNKLYE